MGSSGEAPKLQRANGGQQEKSGRTPRRLRDLGGSSGAKLTPPRDKAAVGGDSSRAHARRRLPPNPTNRWRDGGQPLRDIGLYLMRADEARSSAVDALRLSTQYSGAINGRVTPQRLQPTRI